MQNLIIRALDAHAKRNQCPQISSAELEAERANRARETTLAALRHRLGHNFAGELQRSEINYLPTSNDDGVTTFELYGFFFQVEMPGLFNDDYTGQGTDDVQFFVCDGDDTERFKTLAELGGIVTQPQFASTLVEALRA